MHEWRRQMLLWLWLPWGLRNDETVAATAVVDAAEPRAAARRAEWARAAAVTAEEAIHLHSVVRHAVRLLLLDTVKTPPFGDGGRWWAQAGC